MDNYELTDLPTSNELVQDIIQVGSVESYENLKTNIESFYKKVKLVQDSYEAYGDSSIYSEPIEISSQKLRHYQLLAGGLLGLADAIESKVIGLTCTKVQTDDKKVSQAALEKLAKDRAAPISGLLQYLKVMESNIRGKISIVNYTK